VEEPALVLAVALVPGLVAEQARARAQEPEPVLGSVEEQALVPGLAQAQAAQVEAPAPVLGLAVAEEPGLGGTASRTRRSSPCTDETQPEH